MTLLLQPGRVKDGTQKGHIRRFKYYIPHKPYNFTSLSSQHFYLPPLFHHLMHHGFLRFLRFSQTFWINKK